MRMQIIGLGVVGTAYAYLFDKLGHEVVGFDIKPKNISYAKLLRAPTPNTDLTFVCVHEQDLEGVINTLLSLDVPSPYIIKSTVKPGTTEMLMRKYNMHFIHNPEFLREKYAFYDVMHPSRIIIGQCCQAHGRVLEDLYRVLGAPIYITTPTVSEMVKLAVNLLRATAITFWNEINEICSSLGIDTKEVAKLVDQARSLGEYEGGIGALSFLEEDLEENAYRKISNK
jgi:UDPglucose 6-dehydrogenase